MNIRKRAKVFYISTVVMITITVVVMLLSPPVVKSMLWKIAGISENAYVTGYTVAVCVSGLPFLVMLGCVAKLFSNISKGIVYDISNTRMLRRIAVCSCLQLAICALIFAFVYPLFGYGIGLAVLIVSISSLFSLALSLIFGHMLENTLAINEEEENLI